VKQPSEQDDRQAGLYPIRTVATLTGINPITLRAWERRYGLVKPRRTETGHRLYTQADIDFINRIVTLLEKGGPISQVPGSLARSEGADPAAHEIEAGPWQPYQVRMLGAFTRFDEGAIEEAYNEALALYPVDIVTRRLLAPLLKSLGDRWAVAEGSVAEEHFFGVYLRNTLGARFHHRARSNTGPTFLAACLPGEHHEIGLLLFALSAHDRGFRLVLLGADTPLADLAPTAKRSSSDAVILSGSISPAPYVLERDLPALASASSIPVIVGGNTSMRHGDAMIRAGAIRLGDDIQTGLRQLNNLLGTQHHD
jgi:DNA-binding transcriptional MerR regulator/methylmalonyl-CoA mutase cobalamin-binding subunit